MRAVIIDPFKREVRAVEDDFDDYRVIKQYLAQGERGPLSAWLCGGPKIKFDHHSYVDDEGCFRERQAWFRLHGYPHALAGYTVILRDGPEGDEASADTELVKMLPYAVEWVSAENAQSDFPPVTVSTIDPATGQQTVVSSTPVDFSRREPFERSK